MPQTKTYAIGTPAMIEKEKQQTARMKQRLQGIPDSVFMIVISLMVIIPGAYGILQHKEDMRLLEQERQAAIQVVENSCFDQQGDLIHLPGSETPWLCVKNDSIFFRAKGEIPQIIQKIY
jgi:hypothetical protein